MEMQSEIDSQLKQINDRLNSIEVKIDTLLNMYENVLRTDTRLNSHIDFVEDVYTTVKSPLEYILKKYNFITSITSYNITKSISNTDQS